MLLLHLTLQGAGMIKTQLKADHMKMKTLH
jgi:hypothetical protein